MNEFVVAPLSVAILKKMTEMKLLYMQFSTMLREGVDAASLQYLS